jgi:PPE-repeat protein
MFNNTSGVENTATGDQALFNNTIGLQNTATGASALNSNTTGNFNTANGEAALFSNTTGKFNTATGLNALSNNTIGISNTATGLGALQNNNASNNTATGVSALFSDTTGGNNTAEGFQALLNSTGSNNIALGFNAGFNLTTGSNNIDIGSPGAASEANTIRIGKQGTQKSTFIAGISGIAVTGSAVVVSTTGKLGVATSSARFKKAIRPMDKASEAILSLKPVMFRYKEEIDPDGIPQFGLVAEEVEKVSPDLITRDEAGKPTTVRYEAVNAMLLNEFLKAHRKLEQQQATIEQQQKQIEVLTETVQKVSERIELSAPAPQIAANQD